MSARKQASNKDMNGLKVINVGAPTATSSDASRISDVEAAQAYAISRANHTGTQLAATIPDFDTQVRTNRLDQLTAPTGSVALASQKLINLLDPTTAQDAATKNYVDTSLAGVASGQTLKGTVRAVSLTNVDIASAPSTIDGLTAVAGNVFLLAGQTTGSENGPYTWTGTAAPMTRASNWDTAGKAVVGSYWITEEGTDADKFALLSNDSFTLGTDTGTFVPIGVATAINVPVEQDCGNGALTSFAITHNFGTRAVSVYVHRVAAPYDDIDVSVERTTVNTITLQPDSVWATNEFHVIVGKM